MYWPNCHCSDPRLHSPKRFGWSKPMKPPTPVPWPTDAPKLTLPVRFSLTWKIRSMSPLLVRLARIRRRHVLLEEAEVRDVPIALDQALPIEDVARQDHDLVANARLGRDVVAEDVDRGSRSPACARRSPSGDRPSAPSPCRLSGARRPGACSRRCSPRSRTRPAPSPVAVVPRGRVEDVLLLLRTAADEALHRLRDAFRRGVFLSLNGYSRAMSSLLKTLGAADLEVADLVLRPSFTVSRTSAFARRDR